jgi:ABC-2 type transporter
VNRFSFSYAVSILSPVPYLRLFAWLTPQAFAASKVAGPIGQFLLYVYVVRSSGVYSPAFVVIGSSALLAMFGGMYGITYSFLGARRLGVARDARMSPAGVLGLYVPLAVWATVDGIATSSAILGLGAAMFGVHVSHPAGFAAALLATSASSAALGILTAAVSGYLRDDSGAVVNTVAFLSTVLSGAMIAVGDLPAWLRPASTVWPFAHGIAAARAAARGAGSAGQTALELLVALVLAAASVAVHVITAEGERRGLRPE